MWETVFDCVHILCSSEYLWQHCVCVESAQTKSTVPTFILMKERVIRFNNVTLWCAVFIVFRRQWSSMEKSFGFGLYLACIDSEKNIEYYQSYPPMNLFVFIHFRSYISLYDMEAKNWSNQFKLCWICLLVDFHCLTSLNTVCFFFCIQKAVMVYYRLTFRCWPFSLLAFKFAVCVSLSCV